MEADCQSNLGGKWKKLAAVTLVIASFTAEQASSPLHQKDG